MPRPQTQPTQHRQTPPSLAMAPVTRGRRNRADITRENIEPLSPALTSNTLTPVSSSHNHVRFDQDEENTPIAAQRAGSEMDEITKGANGDRSVDVNEPNTTGNEVLGSQGEEEEEEEEEDSDDDAPEAVSMGAGKKDAEKREEDAKRVVEAQKEADKKKRKERDTKLKEQKAEAQERKRVRDNKRRKLETAEDEQDAAIKDQLNREATGVSEKAEPTPAPTEVTSKKSKLPLLLPESLLAQISARPSPPARRSAEEDSDSDEMDDDVLVRTGNSAGASARLLKNRRRREQKKKNKILKKGVVNVKVLKDEAASRKSMAPPASKQVAHIKESWLQKHRRGGIERRSVGSGFVKRK